jgi:hypothetical protein
LQLTNVNVMPAQYFQVNFDKFQGVVFFRIQDFLRIKNQKSTTFNFRDKKQIQGLFNVRVHNAVTGPRSGPVRYGVLVSISQERCIIFQSVYDSVSFPCWVNH